MKIQHYCYTRNSQIDYGDFILPDISRSKVDYVKKKVLSITGDLNPDLTVPKWILIKYEDAVVWGCCCWNSLLSQEKFKDSLGRPVYGFFSIIITDYLVSEIKLPFDFGYFKKLYSKEIEPYWDASERRKSDAVLSFQNEFKYIQACHNSYRGLLNTDIFRCQSLGNIDKEGVIAAALTLENVSLLIDNDNLEQATNKMGSFMNCLTPSVNFGVYTVRQQCPKCGKYVSFFTATGVCQECKEAENVKGDEIKKEKDTDKHIRMELEKARNRISELESEVLMAGVKLKKKNGWIIALAIVSVMLLIQLLYAYDIFSLEFELFEK